MIDITTLLKDPSNLSAKGELNLFYGGPDVGKTHNILLGLLTLERMKGKDQKPILYLHCEDKGGDDAIIKEKLKIKDGELKALDYTKQIDIESFLGFLYDEEKCKEFGPIFLDGLTHLMRIKWMDEVIEQAHQKRVKKKTEDIKLLTSAAKSSVEDHGTVNRNILRLFLALGQRSKDGRIVVISCHEDVNVPYEGKYVIGPNFSGKEVPSSFQGFFDRIGWVQGHFKKDEGGNVAKDKYGFPIKAFPPIVRFKSDGNFIARGGGVGLLDFGWVKVNKDRKEKSNETRSQV